MTLEEAKRSFIDIWGAMSTSWGINKSMAQIHALLLASKDPLNTDDIMSALGISRGNVSMCLKSLMDWELINRTYVKGSRKDFYLAEKDMWLVGNRIMEVRRRRELDQMLRAIKPLRAIEDEKASSKELVAFNDMIKNLHNTAKMTNRFLKSVGKQKKLRVVKMVNKLGK